jgi:sugar phosphate isomerase/epimerase
VQFGAAIWPFQWNPPYDDGIRRIARLGFRQIELIAWDRDTLKTYYTSERIAALRQLIADEGLILSEFVTTPNGLASSDPARRSAAIDHFKEAIDVAHALGTTIINSVVSTPFDLPVPRLLALPETQEVSVDLPKGLDWRAGYENYIDSVRACAAVCEEAGFRYALETHPHRWATTAQSLLRIIDHVGSPAVGVNMDPSHMFPCGDLPQMAVYELGDRVFHTHFSDNDGQTNAHWRPGKGKIDWSATLAALQDIGYEGVISIELEDVPGRASAGNPVAGEAFDRENLLTQSYLADLGEQLGLHLK